MIDLLAVFEGDDRWIWAIVAVAAGLVLGAIVGWYVRRVLSNQRPELRAVATPASAFLFWLAAATGVILAIGFISPETLRPIPRNVLDWLPNVLAAGLLILAGYAAGIGIAAALGSALTRATGQLHEGAERAVRWTAAGGATVLALGQLGVRTTVLTIIVAGFVFMTAAASALLAGLGGRDVASHIAASRSLRGELRIGDRLFAAGCEGEIVDLTPTTVIVRTDRGRRSVVAYGVLLQSPFEVEAAE
ncbi:MAG: hypothetical protein ACI8Y4_005654 [Candidatus Poriferisodalaceae bacterium]|jgi:hypothetical protein